jgi:hypothetical protein
MDYQTVKASDMYPCDLLRHEDEERGQTATFTYRDEHEWYYLNKQLNSEVTVIKIWDSKTDGVSKCMCRKSSPMLYLLFNGTNYIQSARMHHLITLMYRQR